MTNFSPYFYFQLRLIHFTLGALFLKIILLCSSISATPFDMEYHHSILLFIFVKLGSIKLELKSLIFINSNIQLDCHINLRLSK